MGETNWLDRFWGLVQALGPSEAEAKVVPITPEAQALVDAMASGQVMLGTRENDPLVSGRFHPMRKDMYRNVLQAAEERPEAVTIGIENLRSQGYGDIGGFYRPGSAEYPTDAIRLRLYNPLYSASNRSTNVVPTAVNDQDTLSRQHSRQPDGLA